MGNMRSESRTMHDNVRTAPGLPLPGIHRIRHRHDGEEG